jgi:hypothetical protein
METLEQEKKIKLPFPDDSFMSTALVKEIPERAGSISYLTPEISPGRSGDILSMKVNHQFFETSTKRVKSSINKETLMDIQAIHGIDAYQELVSVLSNETILGNQKVLNGIYKKLGEESERKSRSKWKSFLNKYFNIEFPTYVKDSKELALKIALFSNLIAAKSRRGPGNFIVVSAYNWSLLQELNSTSLILDPVTPMSSGIILVGTINNNIQVFLNSNLSYNDSTVIIGKKSEEPFPGVLFGRYTRELEVMDSYSPMDFKENSEYALIERSIISEFGNPSDAYYTANIVVGKKPLWRTLIGA